MAHVFVSYATPDRDFAVYLFRRLTEAGIQSVVDSKTARARNHWQVDADRVIDESFAVLVVMTPEAKTSESVTYEWAYALGSRKRVIPLVLEPTGLHPRLQLLPSFDFSRDDRSWEALIQALQKAEIEHSGNRLVEALQNPNWETRMVAAEILGQRGDPAVIPLLAATLKDEASEVRMAAAQALGKIGDPAAIPYLQESLYHDETAVRVECVRALGQIEDAAAVQTLMEALQISETRVRWNAAWALGEIGPAAVPGLVAALRDPDGGVRGTAAGALAAMGVAEAVPDLVVALTDESWSVREAAARALGQIKEPAAVHGLIGALHDVDDRVRGTTSSALAAIGAPAVPALTAALNDPEQRVRIAASGALGAMAHKRAAPGLYQALVLALHDEVAQVRALAAWGLGHLGKTAVPLLAQVLRDGDGNVRAAALKALMWMDTPEARATIEAWQRE